MMLRILPDFCIVKAGHTAFIEEMIDNSANQHFKGSGRADAGRADHLGGNTGIKAFYLKTKGTAPPENTRQQGKGSVPLRYCIQMFQSKTKGCEKPWLRTMTHSE